MNRLEHANLSVRDLDAAIRFIQTALPEFRIRWEGRTAQGDRAVHIGDDRSYLALSQASRDTTQVWTPYGGSPGLNHLGFEVDDAIAIRDRLRDAGYRDSTYPNAHPHRTRIYFLDAEGCDWEFVQYHSVRPEERNDYALPDFPAGAAAQGT